MSRKYFGILALILILAGVLIVGGRALYYPRHPQNLPENSKVPEVSPTSTITATPSLDSSFDWQKALKDVAGRIIRHSNAQPIDPELSAFIGRVVVKAAPEGYSIAEHNFPELWIDDLNGDGLYEFLIAYLPTSSTPHNDFYALQKSQFLIVTPIDLEGNHQTIVSIDQSKYFLDSTISYSNKSSFISGVAYPKTFDFDNDGVKEFGTQHPHANKPRALLWKIDWQAGKLLQIKQRAQDGHMMPAVLEDANGFTYRYNSHFEDITGDGIQELVYISAHAEGDNFRDRERWPENIEVFQWDGEIFIYSPQLTQQYAAN